MNQLLKILCIFTILLSGLTVPVISASLKFDVKDYTTIPVGKNEIYDEGRIKIIITDDVSGKTTTGTLIVSRKSAPDWNTMYDSPTTWNCRLELNDANNAHHLSLDQTTVTTTKDINDYYQIMNFRLTLTQHAYYVYDTQKHSGAGNGFRLNFESYAQHNDGAGTITDGIVTKDTVRTINWQINTAALGLRTFEKVRYIDCKSYLSYTRPSHTVTINPNGGYFNGTKSHTVYKVRTGEWQSLSELPSRDFYLFHGFVKQGTPYAYRSAGTGYTTDISSGLTASYSSNGHFTRYRGMNVSEKDSIRFRPFQAKKNHSIRITGSIRVNSLSKGGSVLLYEKQDPSEKCSSAASFSESDGTWKKFDISRTFSSSSSKAIFEIKPSSGTEILQFDLKNIMITDQTSDKRLADTDLQIGDGKDADIILTAQWTPLLYQINYQSSIEDMTAMIEPQTACQDTAVSLKKCTYPTEHASFLGWMFQDTLYREKQIVTYQDLVQKTLQERKCDADIQPEIPEEEDTFTFTALWSYHPVITLKPETTVYTEGEEIFTDQLLDLVKTCTDREDGDLKDRVQIQSIEYNASKDGYRPAAQTLFSKETRLDTYFLHLEKEEKVTASVTFTVTDNDGNTASETGKVLIKYNHPPIIEAQNLSFYTHEIMQFPDRVKKEILENASASDIEDEKRDRKPDIKLSSPTPLDLSNMQKPSVYSITYLAKDSMKKETEKTVRIYVVDSNPYRTKKTQTVRFISKTYLYTLDQKSIWKTDAAYSRYLNDSLNKTGEQAKHTYVFTSGDPS